MERKATLELIFKFDADEVRGIPSLDITRCPNRGVKIQVYCTDEYSAKNEVDVILMIEWYKFRVMNLDRVKFRMKGDSYFNLRNVYAKDNNVKEIFKYYSVEQE